MKKSFSLVFLPLLALPLFAQNTDLRGLKTVVSQLEGETAVVGRQYAVLIAIDKYDSWMALRNPVKDAKEIKDILFRRYYVSDFMELYDGAATKAGIIKLFDRLIKDTRPEDSILIFYAGHGQLDRTSNTGFWIPVDGGTDVYAQANWLPNAQIRGFIGNMKARHVALIADACFSGDFLNPTRGMAPAITNEYFKNAYARISRQVLTSGSSESVPDESPFIRQLKLALEGNTSPYLDPLMLYNQIRLGVTKTTPLFGDLKDSGHQEGSSFLLFLRSDGGHALAAKNPSGEEGLSPKVKVSKAYGTATVETDAIGTLFLDGISQGQVPVGSFATIENLAAGPHEMVMLYEDGEKAAQTVAIKMGKTSAVEFSRSAKAVSKNLPTEAGQTPSVAAAKNTLPPSSLLNGAPLPKASIKIDGNFDDWGNVPPVAVGSQDATDKMSISKVCVAVDAESFCIKLDIADKTPSSFLHAHNFSENPGNPFYGISIDTGESQHNVSVGILHWDRHPYKWQVLIGVWEKTVFRTIEIMEQYVMKGSSVEIAVPFALIKSRLGDLGPTRLWRAYGWTTTSSSSREKSTGNANIFNDLRKTEVGSFTFAENDLIPPAPAAAAAGSAPLVEPIQKIKLPEDQFVFLAAFEGHQYFLSKSSLAWKDAFSLCAKNGGHLVTITSDSENKALMQAIKPKNILDDIWIGFTDENRGWKWVTGEKSDFTYWDVNQPDNAGGVEDYALIWQDSRNRYLRNPLKWNDDKEGHHALFILEIE